MGKRKTSALTQQENSRPSRNDRYSKRTGYQNQASSQNNVVDFVAPKRNQKKNVELIPQTISQEKYIVALTNPNVDIVIATGPAGTGKSYLATLAAIHAYRTGQVDKIVITRPKVAIEDEDHGFLPGTLTEKLAPWVRPIIDIFEEFYSARDIEYMISENILEFTPLGYIRGRTFKRTFLIADEFQNASINQCKSLATRLGEGSKFVIDGDGAQRDRVASQSGLLDFIDKLKEYPTTRIATCEFHAKDIQRHPLISHILKMYGDE